MEEKKDIWAYSTAGDGVQYMCEDSERDLLVVVYECHSIVWFNVDDGIIQNRPQVKSRPPFTRLVEVHMQRDVKESRLL